MANKKRKSLSPKTRFEVFKRDKFTCQYCGAHPPQAVLHVDHIVSVASGGANDIDNLTTACSVCNGGKGAVSLTAVPSTLAERAKEIKEREAQLRGYRDVVEASHARLERDSWLVADVFINQFSKDKSIRRDWLHSIRKFVTQLDVYECIDAMEHAVDLIPADQNRCFSYFCGTCWNKIRGTAR